MADPPVDNLSPQLHNFVFVLAMLLLFVWMLKAVNRGRALLDMKWALKERNVVRLDGLSSSVREIGAISFNHLQQILTSRSRYDTTIIEEVVLPFSVTKGSCKLHPADPGQLSLAFTVQHSRDMVVELIYGLPFAAVEKLFQQRYPDKKEMKRRKKELRKRKQRRGSASRDGAGPTTSSSLALADVQLEQRNGPPFTLEDCVDVGSPLIVKAPSSGTSQSLQLDVALRPLLRGLSQASSSYPLAMLCRHVDADDEKSAASSSESAYRRPMLLTAFRFPKSRHSIASAPASPASDVPSSPASAVPNGDVNSNGPSSPTPDDASPSVPNLTRAVSEQSNMSDLSSPERKGPLDIPQLKVATQLIITPDKLMEMQDIYGIQDEENLECTVCLTEHKDIVSLPCRHCCVCHSCFEHISGQCPVCRSQILSFMQFGFGFAEHLWDDDMAGKVQKANRTQQQHSVEFKSPS